jgi:hypothetical protein
MRFKPFNHNGSSELEYSGLFGINSRLNGCWAGVNRGHSTAIIADEGLTAEPTRNVTVTDPKGAYPEGTRALICKTPIRPGAAAA